MHPYFCVCFLLMSLAKDEDGLARRLYLRTYGSALAVFDMEHEHQSGGGLRGASRKLRFPPGFLAPPIRLPLSEIKRARRG